MKLKLNIWRQESASAKGALKTYALDNLEKDMSFLEMLDVLNERLVLEGERPIVFDHDCREGICGTCGVMINGRAHGPIGGITTCQLHLRSFNDGDELTIEPFRSGTFPVIKDLKVNRTAFDRIISAGGYISASTGSAPEANSILIPHDVAESAFDSAACIGCGACVATCKNGSAALFTSAKISHLAKLPQGRAEARSRVVKMVEQMDKEGFGHCTNTEACEAECPMGVSVLNIAQMNWEYNKALLLGA